MNKFWLIVIGVAAAILALANLGSLIALSISVAITYYTAKWFFKTESLFKKVVWGTIAAVAGLTAIANVPAILGVAAIYVVYVIYKKWQDAPETTNSKDPFVNFEKQWEELTKKSK
ncbi:flagellar basal body rod protein [Jeotgalibacillus sp. S-D1]|uniref:lmo0954 family membrane protein n=1 Tax=Jeotgalibacillus sp. S-D1 TaxID=2552189 RepID=UPI00105A3F56|nr:flagellar basal body rod protein [Jeotgalibacillus sp. S-D1]TDL30720.1 flagellar basal body rod protein [Jeotgalibacillus sp. S-D1]